MQVNFPDLRVVGIVLAQILGLITAFETTKKAPANYDDENDSPFLHRTSESNAAATSPHCD